MADAIRSFPRITVSNEQQQNERGYLQSDEQTSDVFGVNMHRYRLDPNEYKNPDLQNQLGTIDSRIAGLQNQKAPTVQGAIVGRMAQAQQQRAGYQGADGAQSGWLQAQAGNDARVQQALGRSKSGR